MGFSDPLGTLVLYRNAFLMMPLHPYIVFEGPVASDGM